MLLLYVAQFRYNLFWRSGLRNNFNLIEQSIEFQMTNLITLTIDPYYICSLKIQYYVKSSVKVL